MKANCISIKNSLYYSFSSFAQLQGHYYEARECSSYSELRVDLLLKQVYCSANSKLSSFLKRFSIQLVERLSQVKVVLLIHCVMSIFVDASIQFIEILEFISSKIHTASCLELIELILWTYRHRKMIFQLSFLVLFIINSTLKRLRMLVLFRV